VQQRIHSQEKEQFIKLFKQDHVEDFEDRFKVLEVFLQTEKHVTAEELTNLLVHKGYGLKSDFVRSTLKMMCQYGFAQRNRFDNGVVRYEHLHLGQHHDHLICTKCHKIIEFADESMENLQVQIALTYGFHLLQHKMELYGICADCLKERISRMPLMMAKQGERVIIEEITGGAAVRIRLMTMGLRIGDQIEVITNLNKGQLVIASDFKRLVIGRGLAQKIMVRPPEEPKGQPVSTHGGR
jgi:Fur family ferric uptake transcriptional regulator